MLSDARLIIVGLLVCLLAFGPIAMADELHQKIALSGGITQDRNNTSETGASIGLLYEYPLNKFWGVGGLLEYAGGDIDAWVVGVPVFAHPFAGWFVVTAPGLELESDETNVILRVGTGYEFELGERFALAPEFYMDLNRKNGTKWVYGLSLVWNF